MFVNMAELNYYCILLFTDLFCHVSYNSNLYKHNFIESNSLILYLVSSVSNFQEPDLQSINLGKRKIFSSWSVVIVFFVRRCELWRNNSSVLIHLHTITYSLTKLLIYSFIYSLDTLIPCLSSYVNYFTSGLLIYIVLLLVVKAGDYTWQVEYIYLTSKKYYIIHGVIFSLIFL